MNGILILDKPQGFTSFDAVAVLRGLAREKKIGHTGTLDPMATGVLPVLLGRAAKALNFLPDTDKEYTAAFRLGERRDTGDITGQVVEESPAPVSQEALEAALPAFRGEILQVPPMYSAVSVNGKRLYELARKGLEVERQARPVTVSALELLSYDAQSREGRLRVACSKGTYIRVLIEDIAKAAGSCGTMTALRRVRACGFGEGDARSLEELKALCGRGEINAAENLLFEELDFSDPGTLHIALAFYEHLNRFTDQELEARDYSREEIFEGVKDCAEQYGMDPQLLEAFRP